MYYTILYIQDIKMEILREDKSRNRMEFIVSGYG